MNPAYPRHTWTQLKIVELCNAARAELKAAGFDKRMGSDAIFSRASGQVEIVGARVFGYNSDKQRDFREVMYPDGWVDDIAFEVKNPDYNPDDEPPL